MPADRPSSEFVAHMWIGCDLFAWLRILHQGRYRVTLKKSYLPILATVLSTGHTFLRYAQTALFSNRIRTNQFAQDPIFILGHWRCGTTLLHEYLIQDDQFAYPTTSDCFDPCHTLLTSQLLRKYCAWMLPSKRVMDNMPMGWDRPQEDEFALCLLGAPSPYRRLAFPNQGPIDEQAYDLEELKPSEKHRWEATFFRWLQILDFRYRKQLVLKSPPHTCRIPTILKLFPKAKFIHLRRDPYVVYASTLNLWKRLHESQGLDKPHHRGLEQYVFERFIHFHRRYEATKRLIPEGQLVELKYEDLVANPLDEVKKIYQHLAISGFEQVHEKLNSYIQQNTDYQRNQWVFSPEVRDQINRKWGDVIQEQGYQVI